MRNSCHFTKWRFSIFGYKIMIFQHIDFKLPGYILIMIYITFSLFLLCSASSKQYLCQFCHFSVSVLATCIIISYTLLKTILTYLFYISVHRNIILAVIKMFIFEIIDQFRHIHWNFIKRYCDTICIITKLEPRKIPTAMLYRNFYANSKLKNYLYRT